MQTETIQVSKCCEAETEDIEDVIGDYVLTACKTCGQECQTKSVCADCRGRGMVKEWRGEDDYVMKVCPCSVESVAEMRGEALMEMAKGN